jgi:hypothetical protein
MRIDLLIALERIAARAGYTAPRLILLRDRRAHIRLVVP